MGESGIADTKPGRQKTVPTTKHPAQTPTVPSCRNLALEGCPNLEGNFRGVTHGSYPGVFLDTTRVAVVVTLQGIVSPSPTQFFMFPDPNCHV